MVLLARNNFAGSLTALVFGILVQAGTVVQTHPSWSALGVDSSITLAVQGLDRLVRWGLAVFGVAARAFPLEPPLRHLPPVMEEEIER